jgi:DNA-binding SARP family transcriptional activator
MARLSLSLLGPFQVTLDGQPVTDFKSNKIRALLTYLAMEADRPHRREVLAGLLWPDWPERDALSNLRYALSDLRRAIGDRTAEPPFLLITRGTLQFDAASDHWLDVAVFMDLTSNLEDPPALEQAIVLYRGSFLEGFSIRDSAAFEEWTLFAGERLARQMSSALHHLAATYEQQGEYHRAESFARQQLELEPWNEGAHRQLMRALALDGKRSVALAQYQTCRRLLAKELAVEPAAETTALYEKIRDGTLIAPLVSPLPPVPSMSLPPFLNKEGLDKAEPPVFVARECELARLDHFLERSLAGQGQVVFVTGDAGSGKTALLHAFARRAQEAHPDLVVAGGQCNAYTGVGDPYLPFREVLDLLTGDVEARWAAGAMYREQACRLWHLLPVAVEVLVQSGPDLLDLFVPGTPLLSRAGAVQPETREKTWLARLEALMARRAEAPGLPAQQQIALFEQYTNVLLALANHTPLLLTLDDLQWADSGSLHLLFHLGRCLVGSSILLVGAYRPSEIALGRSARPAARGMTGGRYAREQERHPLEPIVHELKRTFGDVEVDLERVEGRPFVDALLDSEPNCLGESFRTALHRRTRGHPLFTVELLRGMQERGDLARDSGGRWVEGAALSWDVLPARVEAVVAERIRGLPQSLRELLTVASVEGEIFTAEVISLVQETDDRQTVRSLSEVLDRQHRLVGAHGIRRLDTQRLSRYRFRHILFQTYLYRSLDRVERAYLHEQVGAALEELYSARETADVALQLARHFEEAAIPDKAIHYLRLAGERAVRLSAYQEGVTHLSRALALLMTLSDSPARDERELALQAVFGMAAGGAFGTHSVKMKEAYARVRDLSLKTGKMSQSCQALGEQSLYHFVRAEHREAREFAEQALAAARRVGDPLLIALGHWYLGVALFWFGEYTSAHDHLDEVVAFYNPQEHHSAFVLLRGSDAGVSALAYSACAMWCLGYPQQAVERSQKALRLARDLDHPFSLADVLGYAGCLLSEICQDGPALRDYAQELMELSREKVDVWVPTASIYMGAALIMLGQVKEGIAQIHEAMAMSRVTGERCIATEALLSLARAQAMEKRPEEGLTTIAEGLDFVKQTDQRYLEAELHRLRAELLLTQGDLAEAEAGLHRAIQVARRQQAKSWELRATTSLARLWRDQGKEKEAQQTLAEVYGWFTEGFDTPDLKHAKALLEELQALSSSC